MDGNIGSAGHAAYTLVTTMLKLSHPIKQNNVSKMNWFLLALILRQNTSPLEQSHVGFQWNLHDANLFLTSACTSCQLRST